MSDAEEILRVESVGHRFGGVAALARVSFQARGTEVTSIIGPNGAGKTTLFNVVTGFLRPHQGQVSYRGESLLGLRPYQVAERGLIRTFQRTSLFAGVSVRDNLLIALHRQGSTGLLDALLRRPRVRAENARLADRADQILALMGLSHRASHLAGALPYGEQRLLEIAIALAANPRLLLLDEPAAGLNPAERAGLVELIRHIRAQGIGVVLVEHDMRLVMGISDSVVCLDHGQVVCQGSPDLVQAHPEVIRAYLGTT